MYVLACVGVFQSMPSTLATTKLPLPVVEVEAGRRNANSFSFHRCIRFFNVFYRDAYTLILISKLERGVFQCPSFQTFPTYQNLSRDGSFEWIVGPFFLNLPNDNRPWRIIKQICTVYFQVMRGNCQYHAEMLQKITTVNKIDGRKFQSTNLIVMLSKRKISLKPLFKAYNKGHLNSTFNSQLLLYSL